MRISSVLLSLLLLHFVGAKHCFSGADCKANQCCAGILPFLGRCKRFARHRRRCHRTNVRFETGIYRLVCPCASDLICKASLNKEGELRRKGQCFKRPKGKAPEQVEDVEKAVDGDEEDWPDEEYEEEEEEEEDDEPEEPETEDEDETKDGKNKDGENKNGKKKEER